MIVIVDYGMGNPASVRNMLHRIGCEALVSGSPEEVLRADRLILPGVGAFDAAIRAIRSRGLSEVLDARVSHDRVPLLGICLGMQLMSEGSDEGSEPGFGWIRGRTRALPKSGAARVPHMGWNAARVVRQNSLVDAAGEDPRFYFVHSYYVDCESDADVILRTTHGIDFASALQHGNLHGVQFHPEKSHRFGMKLLERFTRL